MYPLFSRLFVGLGIFAELYFIILLNYGITSFRLGPAELTGAFTVFGFLLLLRVADDFKDYETDKRLFPERALPSGKVHKRDLIVLLVLVEAAVLTLNILFMNNLAFFLILYLYGGFMSVWFFQKNKIQKSLPLALVTHNPVQLFVNIYVISFVCIKYGLDWRTLTVCMAALTLYFPGLIWEVSRKIRAPKDETEYTTYSKLFGYKKATRFVLILTLADLITNLILVWNLNTVSILLLLINAAWMTVAFIRFIKDPTRFELIKMVLRYTFIQETLMILTVVAYLLFGKL
jgi:4-hydroxybenzoate polyprenyltransferase